MFSHFCQIFVHFMPIDPQFSFLNFTKTNFEWPFETFLWNSRYFFFGLDRIFKDKTYGKSRETLFIVNFWMFITLKQAPWPMNFFSLFLFNIKGLKSYHNCLKTLLYEQQTSLTHNEIYTCSWDINTFVDTLSFF